MTSPITGPKCLYIVWRPEINGDTCEIKLSGAAFYEQTVHFANGKIDAVVEGEAQPVGILGQKGIDINGLIGKIGADAIALAEAKAAELDAATKERDTEKQRAEQLAAQLAELQGQATSGVPQRVPTAALLLLFKRQGLTAQLDAVLAALPSEQQGDMQYLLQMPYTRRDHPMVEMLRQAFGWTPEQVDALFAEADAV